MRVFKLYTEEVPKQETHQTSIEKSSFSSSDSKRKFMCCEVMQLGVDLIHLICANKQRGNHLDERD